MNRRLYRIHRQILATAQEPPEPWCEWKDAHRKSNNKMGKLEQRRKFKIAAWNITILQKDF